MKKDFLQKIYFLSWVLATVLGVALFSNAVQAQAISTDELTDLLNQAQRQATEDGYKTANTAIADVLAQSHRGSGGAKEEASLFNQTRERSMTQAELDAALVDKKSAQYKAHKLADQARANDALYDAGAVAEEQRLFEQMTPPPEMESLQDVKRAHGAKAGEFDDVLSEDIALDMREDAQKEAALSYGARGGLAKRNYQIMERLEGYDGVLDQVFAFRQLLVKAPSGLMIEPPIVRENLEAILISHDGNEAAVADQVLKINKQAKIVTAPRDWRQYLIMYYDTEIAPPPKILWPKNTMEQASWNNWVRKGWGAGYAQGDSIFETNLNQLLVDYNGMVRYRMLLAQGKISQPFALQEDRGVTGGKNVMRVGDRALRITGPSEFLTGANLWKPADR